MNGKIISIVALKAASESKSAIFEPIAELANEAAAQKGAIFQLMNPFRAYFTVAAVIPMLELILFVAIALCIGSPAST